MVRLIASDLSSGDLVSLASHPHLHFSITIRKEIYVLWLCYGWSAFIAFIRKYFEKISNGDKTYNTNVSDAVKTTEKLLEMKDVLDFLQQGDNKDHL